MIPPRPLISHQRRQAQPHTHRAAMLDSTHAWAASIFPVSPRTPQGLENCRAGDRESGRWARPIVFSHGGVWRHRIKPVDVYNGHHIDARGSKAGGAFARFEIPQSVGFYPHFELQRPQASFPKIDAISISISLFLEEKEEKETAAQENGPSTKLTELLNVYPRIGTCIHTFLVAEKAGTGQCWRGFQLFWVPIHTSTGGNALGLGGTGRLEVTK